MTSEDDELLGRIPRDAKNEWKIVKGKSWNIDYIDIRLYENNKPTKKGARLNLEEIVTLKQILEKIKLGDEKNDMEI
tara:strand:+ start:160 stop:390 length:231 start_codon:yes stop_codon:yes gene_type:complete